MQIKLNTQFADAFVDKEQLGAIEKRARIAHKTLLDKNGKGNDYLGWLHLPENYDREEHSRIKKAAGKIRSMCEVFVVIGIGGSYLGARAAIEYIKGNLYNITDKGSPEIYFAGNGISASALNEIIGICREKDFVINVISKSGTTTEPAIAFRVLRSLLNEKYGEEEAKKRIFATTDREKGTLKRFSDENGYETFVVPDDIGGRFSVLTAVGLLPLEVAGIDTSLMLAGALDCMKESFDNPDNECCKYAIYRNAFLEKGKTTEILVSYEPCAQMLAEWWKQLYGESEGKDGKGIYPSSVIFSTDLHSLGQYIQDGQRIIFETVLDIKDAGCTLAVPYDEADVDGLNFLSGKPVSEINRTAMLGTLFAHTDGGVPNLIIEVPDKSAYTLGYLIYFFEFACAVSGYILDVNPFNQPGVEAYKKNMFALLGKSGYEDLRQELSKRMN